MEKDRFYKIIKDTNINNFNTGFIDLNKFQELKFQNRFIKPVFKFQNIFTE